MTTRVSNSIVKSSQAESPPVTSLTAAPSTPLFVYLSSIHLFFTHRSILLFFIKPSYFHPSTHPSFPYPFIQSFLIHLPIFFLSIHFFFSSIHPSIFFLSIHFFSHPSIHLLLIQVLSIHFYLILPSSSYISLNPLLLIFCLFILLSLIAPSIHLISALSIVFLSKINQAH